MKRTAIVALTCIVISLASVYPAHSYSKPSDSYDDAVAAALARFNAADVEYNNALAARDGAMAANKAINEAKINASAVLQAANAEFDAAYKAGINCRIVKPCDELAASARYSAAVEARTSAIDAYGQAHRTPLNPVPLADVFQKGLNRTKMYNLYLDALAIAAKNKTGIQLSPKVLTPNSNPASETIANAPIIKYKNCTKLRKSFPKGVAKSAKLARKTGAAVNANVYNLNSEFDRDRDGIVCEVA